MKKMRNVDWQKIIVSIAWIAIFVVLGYVTRDKIKAPMVLEGLSHGNYVKGTL